MRRLATLALLIACLVCGARAQPAQTIYANARIYTSTPAYPVADSIAIRNGRIVACSTWDEARRFRSRGTKVIDLEGRTILPGLIDAHGHLAGLGALQLGVIDLSGAASYDEVVEQVRARAADEPEGTWILGRGWDHESWPSRELPDHRALSDAVPDHPVWLERVDGHAGLANQAAMRAAGVDSGTPSPDGGEVMRAGDEPTGVFVDNAMELIGRAVPASAHADAAELILAAQRICLSQGITSVHDMGVSPAQAELYRVLEADGRLKLRVHALISAPFAMRYFEEHDPYLGDRLQVRGCKLYADGAMGSRGAWLLEPYADRPADDAGNPYTGLAVSDPAFIESVARHALEHGYQVCTHAIGDRANREVLDAYERALASADGDHADHRFRVEHAQLLHPDDVGRFGALGIIPSMQPRHCATDQRWVEARVGPERARGAYAWRSLLDAGARIAAGSDFPVEPPNPFLGFHAAVTRQDPSGHPEGGWFGEQRMTREEALQAFTVWAARAAFMEDRVGTLAPGMRADFVVVDRDPMTCPEGEIAGTRVLTTVIDGETVYEAPRE